MRIGSAASDSNGHSGCRDVPESDPGTALLLPSLLGACHFGPQEFLSEQLLLPTKHTARRLDDLLYGVHNRTPFLPSALFLLLTGVLLVILLVGFDA